MSKVIIETYTASWCPHCVAFKPELQRLEKMISGNIELKNYDADKDSDFISKNRNIEGFPTILFNVGGKFKEYNGNRKAEDILNQAKQLAGTKMSGGSKGVYYTETRTSVNGETKESHSGEAYECNGSECRRRKINNMGEFNNFLAYMNQGFYGADGTYYDGYDPNTDYYAKYLKYKNKYIDNK